MAEIESTSIHNRMNVSAERRRWMWSIVTVVLLAGVTIATLRWQDPLRRVINDYIGVEETVETVGPIDETPQRLRQIDYSNEVIVTEATPQSEVNESDPLADENLDTALTPSISTDVSSPVSVAEPGLIEAIQLELLKALVLVDKEDDSTSAIVALERARTLAIVHRMSNTLVRALEQAISDVTRSSGADLEIVLEQLDALTEVIATMNVDVTLSRSNASQPNSFAVNDETESQSFWGELGDGLGRVYRVRRVDVEATPSNESSFEAGLQLRLIVLLERARNDIQREDFDAYRETLRMAIVSVDARVDEGVQVLDSIRDELAVLMSLDLESPYESIRAALDEIVAAQSVQHDEVEDSQ